MSSPNTNENGTYKLSTEKRLTTLEQNYLSLKDDISELKNNHLAHLEKKIDRIHWLLVTALVSILTIFIKQMLP